MDDLPNNLRPEEDHDSTEERHGFPSRLLRCDGYAAHQTVPMDSWCISQEDLQKFRIVVADAIKEGRVYPTDLDNFSTADNVYGPCVHTVVHQLIKSVTYISGGQSWALLAHPDGLKCDLFVSHGWAEGIYEFIDKVLNSWPRGAKHAYCCMFSNPQCLDISAMIRSPSDSPFAHALRAATYVLVVPNRHESIYNRIWCVYEVYLAYAGNKMILTASAPIMSFKTRLLVPMLVFICSVITFTCTLPEDPYEVVYRWGFNDVADRLIVNFDLAVILAFVACVAPSGIISHLVNYSGLLVSAFSCSVHIRTLLPYALGGFVVEYMYDSCDDCSPSIGVVLYAHFIPCAPLIMAAWFLACFLGAAADNMLSDASAQERRCLNKSFTGHVRDAKSSVESDRIAILNEIRLGGVEWHVDQTVEVLVRSGVSTKLLQDAAKEGVVVEDAASIHVSSLLLGYGHFFLMVWKFFEVGFPLDWQVYTDTLGIDMDNFENGTNGQYYALFRFGNPMLFVLCLINLGLVLFTSLDNRAFRCRLSAKLALILFLLYEVGMYIIGHLCVMQVGKSTLNFADLETIHFDAAFLWAHLCVACVNILFSAMGLQRMVRIPMIGAPLARFLLLKRIRTKRLTSLSVPAAHSPESTRGVNLELCTYTSSIKDHT